MLRSGRDSKRESEKSHVWLQEQYKINDNDTLFPADKIFFLSRYILLSNCFVIKPLLILGGYVFFALSKPEWLRNQVLNSVLVRREIESRVGSECLGSFTSVNYSIDWILHVHFLFSTSVIIQLTINKKRALFVVVNQTNMYTASLTFNCHAHIPVK